jgi:hypothetical protein
MHPGAYDAKAYLKYMDEMGIWAMVMYPNVGGFGAQQFLKLNDPEQFEQIAPRPLIDKDRSRPDPFRKRLPPPYFALWRTGARANRGWCG